MRGQKRGDSGCRSASDARATGVPMKDGLDLPVCDGQLVSGSSWWTASGSARRDHEWATESGGAAAKRAQRTGNDGHVFGRNCSAGVQNSDRVGPKTTPLPGNTSEWDMGPRFSVPPQQMRTLSVEACTDASAEGGTEVVEAGRRLQQRTGPRRHRRSSFSHPNPGVFDKRRLRKKYEQAVT